MPIKPQTPLAVPAAIPSIESAIKLDGGKDGSTRISLDLYLSKDELPQLADLRGKRLIVVFTEELQTRSKTVDLPSIEAINLGEA